jgi:hypothetical protein
MTTEPSTIYALCPKCRSTSLVEHAAGTYRCASCSFDYKSLAGDTAKRERWMLENLRTGPAGQLVVLHLHRLLLGLPLAESNAQVVAFAEAHGVKLPTGKPTSPALLAAIVLGVVALLVVALLMIGR